MVFLCAFMAYCEEAKYLITAAAPEERGLTLWVLQGTLDITKEKEVKA